MIGRAGAVLIRGAVFGVLSTWAAGAVLVQMDVARELTGRLDPMRLYLPKFRFFGPRPGTYDTHVLVRVKRDDESLGQWQELVGGAGPRRWHHLFWAPQHRVDKVFFELAKSLEQQTKKDYRELVATQAYRVLRNSALYGVDHGPEAGSVQFAVGRSGGFDHTVAPQLVFVSMFHSLRQPRRRRSDDHGRGHVGDGSGVAGKRAGRR